MRKSTFIVGAVALLAVGALFASNMGFKINYQMLAGTNAGSDKGINSLALPYNAQTGVIDAQTLADDIGSANVLTISKYVESNDGYFVYPTDGNFSLSHEEAYYVRLLNDVNYIVVGSHDPSATVSLESAGDPNSDKGINFVAYPYHSTSSLASELANEIGSTNVLSIGQYVESNDGLTIYPTDGDFSLVPGEGYFIRMLANQTWTPSHY